MSHKAIAKLKAVERDRSVIYDLDWVSNWTTRRYQIGWSKL